eukprot:TRINITY_DN57095_c0_g1_i1.p1 TRINITY_DN57095_c0_g1~~TRINITY_DN57095_c0_g1_i1.p1  ORF type:complete len:446 (-),score=93.53 TRINITY_DN57095_c0_g1_i1:19-1281(-)
MAVGGLGAQPATLGVRSLREDYCKPSSRSDIPRNLKCIEDAFNAGHFGKIASEERNMFPRFQYLFQGGELLPAVVFMQALELGPYETINGRQLPFDSEILVLRDNLVVNYKPLVAKVRQIQAREISELPDQLLRKFAKAWTAWESAWLRNREVHAVDALQPLASAILSLEPLLKSAEKERLLPWPRVQHQKAVTLKCLEGFMESFGKLAACVLPSMSRELHHDPKLLLLMDHVISLQGNKPVVGVLDGLSAAPDVGFPDHQRPGPREHTAPNLASQTLKLKDGGFGVSLDAYAFKLLGASVGDAVSSGRLRFNSGNGQAGRAKLMMSPGLGATAASLEEHQHLLRAHPKDGDLAKRAVAHAGELISAFENVKDVLMSLKSTLEHIDPALDRDETFVSMLQRFERAFKRSKRLFLEPDNLA